MANEKEEQNKENSEIGYVKPRDINQEMEESYLDYAMSVIVSRALPDVRDGLKPVHRRILYAMNNLGLRAGAKFRKSATVVGEVLGKYHPHGDVAVYDSMVRMAQDFAMRYPLINGQGNFGSMDGDSAAAMRYTEAKMTSMAEELLVDIDKETINFVPNYDGTQKEPAVLPAKTPNLLINGTMGIAVGMATNIPPHNLTEVIDASVHLIDNPETTVEDLLVFIKGPDFPTGGVIYDAKEISQAYGTGKGSIVMRAVSEVIEDKKGNQKIIITELPYQINKATLVTRIAELIKDKKIQGVSDLRDESNREGVRIVLDLKKDAYPKKILNQLYKMTPMQSAFYVNMLALVDGIQPRVLTLKMVLEEYIKHRREVVTRRCEYELKRAKERSHILEGLLVALGHIDEVISTIKKSATKEEAHKNLVKKFKLTDIQATAILEMKLSTLAGLERKKIEDEYKELKKFILELEDILSHPKKVLSIVKKELSEVKEKYGDERKTKVIKSSLGQFTEEDLVPNEEVIVTLTRGNYIKRTATNIYRAQNRGGKGVMGMATKEEDVVDQLVKTMTHDNMLFFTNQGRVFQLKVYDIPAASRIAKGQAIVNLLNIAPGEKVTVIINLPSGLASNADLSNNYLIMITKKGTVKKTAIKHFLTVRKSGLTCIKLDKGDELKWVRVTSGKDEIVMGTSLGQAIRFKEQDVRPMGRGARGVRGMRLRSGDEVVGADTIKLKSELLVIMENGYGKRTEPAQFALHRRGGVGIRTALVTSKTGRVVDVRVIESSKDDLLIISARGQLIRMPIVSVSKIGRSTQGVRVMRLNAGDRISSVAYLGKNDSIDIAE